MSRLLWASVLAIAGAAMAAPGPTAGRLCIGGSACRDASCGTVVDPASERRAFTIAGKANQYRLGVLHSSATVIRCAQEGLLEITIPTPASRSPVTVLLSEAGESPLKWELAIRHPDLRSPLMLSMPEGRYAVDVHAPHSIRYRQNVDVSAERQRVVAHLAPLPLLSGHIVDGQSGRDIAGAVIRTDVGIDGVADATGRFVVEADPERWPRAITVNAVGYARAEVPVPAARVGVALDEVALFRGGTVAVELRQNDAAEVVEVALQRLGNGGRSPGPTVKTAAVAKDEQPPTLRFENIEPGEYVVVAKGAEEWERLGERVTISAGRESNLTLRIVPFTVRLRVRQDGAEVGGAHVVLKQRDAHWQGTLLTDAAGEASVRLWQGGRLNATVEAAHAMPFLERRTLVDGVDTEWLLDVPIREISGVVVDGETEAAIPGAAVHLSIDSIDGYSLGVSTKADAHGAFRFVSAPYGEHTLKAAAPGYPPHGTTYSFHEPDQSRQVRLALERAANVVLSVLSDRGVPIAGARMIDFRGLVKRGTGTTDGAGAVTVLVSKRESRDVWVVPRDGSFAWIELRPDAEKAVLRVPPAVSRIVLHTRSESQVPIPNVSVVIRYNGRVLPFEVEHALATVQGSRTRSGTDGRIVFDHMPAGVYEFWPVGSFAELRALAGGVGPEAPVRLVAGPGENVAVITFAAVEDGS